MTSKSDALSNVVDLFPGKLDNETYAPWSNDPDDPADCHLMTAEESMAAALKVKHLFFPEHEWDACSAVAACEGLDDEEHSEETLISAWQFVIDHGMCLKLQGSFRRQAMDLINRGICTAPPLRVVQ